MVSYEQHYAEYVDVCDSFRCYATYLNKTPKREYTCRSTSRELFQAFKTQMMQETRTFQNTCKETIEVDEAEETQGKSETCIYKSS